VCLCIIPCVYDADLTSGVLDTRRMLPRNIFPHFPFGILYTQVLPHQLQLTLSWLAHEQDNLAKPYIRGLIGNQFCIDSKPHISHRGFGAGVLDALLENPDADFRKAEAYLRMEQPLDDALQAYKDRSEATGQSVEHTVMLQAGVQGW